MGVFTPPAGSAVATPSPTAGVQITSLDQIHYDAIYGTYIYGGRVFTDTLGGFYPVVITPAGSLTINASPNVASTNLAAGAIVFHNTASVGTDELIGIGGTNALFFAPNSVTSVNNQIVIADRTTPTSNYLGWIFDPAFTSGPTTLPRLRSSSAVGTVTTLFFNSVFYASNNGIFEAAASDGSSIIDIETGLAFDPTIIVSGSLSNINLYLEPKGSGVVGFAYAKTALGGGATPTLGTIGGSGPASAGQNAWLAVKIGTSPATFWIPVWQ